MITSKAIRILTADDHPLIREGLSALISLHADMAIVGEAADGATAIRLFNELRPDVLLLDLQMPNLSGLEVIERLLAQDPTARIIVLTTYDTEQLATKAMGAGASAYILKSSVGRKLLDTIRAVMRGQRYVDPGVASVIAEHAHAEDLTSRELEVLALISKGNSNKLIGDELQISVQTVKGHVKNIFSKLRANDRAHAVALSVKRGIIDV